MKLTDKFITKAGREITFRPPTIKDVIALKNYINKISLERSFLLVQGFQQTTKSETAWLKNKLEKISKNEAVYLCAFFKNKLIGSAEVTLHSGAKSHVGNFGISIAKDFRGQGIGKKLMELVLSQSIKNIKGLKIVELEVFGKNKLAHEMYSKFGFVEFGCLPGGVFRRGRYDDAILMYKKVS